MSDPATAPPADITPVGQTSNSRRWVSMRTSILLLAVVLLIVSGFAFHRLTLGRAADRLKLPECTLGELLELAGEPESVEYRPVWIMPNEAGERYIPGVRLKYSSWWDELSIQFFVPKPLVDLGDGEMRAVSWEDLYEKLGIPRVGRDTFALTDEGLVVYLDFERRSQVPLLIPNECLLEEADDLWSFVQPFKTPVEYKTRADEFKQKYLDPLLNPSIP